MLQFSTLANNAGIIWLLSALVLPSWTSICCTSVSVTIKFLTILPGRAACGTFLLLGIEVLRSKKKKQFNRLNGDTQRRDFRPLKDEIIIFKYNTYDTCYYEFSLVHQLFLK
jgi:hypothetical protein